MPTMKWISKFVQDALRCHRYDLLSVVVTGEVVEPLLVVEVVMVVPDIVKATHGALLVYCSQSPVKAMPAFRMVW